MKYYKLTVHGYIEYFMKDEVGVFHYAEIYPNKWVRTIVAEDRIKKMKEITILDLISELKKKVIV